jgi:tetratricopeptide (TPR) repeat protein
LAEHYTQSEVGRIVGLEPRQLRYWERLRLVRPLVRWRERFYSFSDIVALETIKRLTEKRIPARRLRRAITALEHQLGESQLPLEKLRVLANGRQVIVIPPGPGGKPLEPLTGQWVLGFLTEPLARKVHRMASRGAEEWFELALACDAEPGKLEDSAAAYRRVVELEPRWVEAHINLGVTLYHLGQLREARRAFSAALALEPGSAVAHFNLGCVLDELDELDQAIEHLRQAVKMMPAHADAHFNLAMAYEKRGEPVRAREHWSLYLRHEPRGAWADYARARLAGPAIVRRPSAPIPFRKKP